MFTLGEIAFPNSDNSQDYSGTKSRKSSRRLSLILVEENVETGVDQKQNDSNGKPERKTDYTKSNNLQTVKLNSSTENVPVIPPHRGSNSSETGPSQRNLRKLSSFRGVAMLAKTLVSLQHDVNSVRLNRTHFYKAIKPLFLGQMISGCFFTRAERENKWSKSRIYCTVILLILFLNMIRSLTAFNASETFGTVLFFKIKITIFWYESFSRALLGYMMCMWKKGGLEEFFVSLDRICYIDGIIDYEIRLKRLMKLFIAYSFLLTFCNVAFTSWGLFGPQELQNLHDAFMAPLPSSAPGLVAAKIFILLLIFFNSLIAGFTLGFFSVVCYILYREFAYVCVTFKRAVSQDGEFTADLDKFRIVHHKRCKLVEAADGLFKVIQFY